MEFGIFRVNAPIPPSPGKWLISVEKRGQFLVCSHFFLLEWKVFRTKVVKLQQIFYVPLSLSGDRGGTVVKVLCYKSEGRWFDPKWCHWNFSLTKSFRSHYGPGVDSASKRNE